jgi:hypothetical protein
VDDSGFLRTPDRLFKLCDSHMQQSEALRAMTGAYELYNLGGSTTRMCCSNTFISTIEHF